MKKTLISLLLIALTLNCFSQVIEDRTISPIQKEDIVAVNLGVLMGGGGLVGADFQLKVAPRMSIQAGVGLSSFGAGINYHLKPTISSSFITLQYWQQGFRSNFYGSYIGPMFVFRAKKIFQAGIGLAYVLDKGYNSKLTTDMILLYNIGVYFPL